MPSFQYRKSSYSDPERECVEVAGNVPGIVAIRDSKDLAGPTLRFPPPAWHAFQTAIRESELKH
ncbi:DUF397 domain-containing protein [Streptomyces sp. NPDC052236]|uniref:DUF397 domain-containing protein n=1 Tax=Streptomyces sp. NPDC052236 TaxID=3365686 RepID=UPI0037D639D0